MSVDRLLLEDNSGHYLVEGDTGDNNSTILLESSDLPPLRALNNYQFPSVGTGVATSTPVPKRSL